MSGVGDQQALLDYVSIDRHAEEILMDMNVLRWATGEITDHF